MAEQVSEWKNTTSGHIGVVKYDDEGKPRGVSVRSGGTVLLTEKDRVATANAPAKAANNPFSNGSLQLVTAEADMTHRRPIGDATATPTIPAEDPEPEPAPEAPPEAPPAAETGAAPPPQGESPQGQAAPHEEAAPAPAEDSKPAPSAPSPSPTPTPTPEPK